MSVVKHDETNECKSIPVYPRYDEQAMEVDDLSRDHIRRESLLTNLGISVLKRTESLRDSETNVSQQLDGDELIKEKIRLIEMFSDKESDDSANATSSSRNERKAPPTAPLFVPERSFIVPKANSPKRSGMFSVAEGGGKLTNDVVRRTESFGREFTGEVNHIFVAGFPSFTKGIHDNESREPRSDSKRFNKLNKLYHELLDDRNAQFWYIADDSAFHSR